MAETPFRGIRVPPELESAARAAAPELVGLDFAVLARVGLAVLAAGVVSTPVVRDAIAQVGTRRGPKLREGAAA
jgi:hypothetical protein